MMRQEKLDIKEQFYWNYVGPVASTFTMQVFENLVPYFLDNKKIEYFFGCGYCDECTMEIVYVIFV